MSLSSPNPVLYYLLLAFCLLLGLMLMVLAWRRPRQRQRAARVLASAGAAGALWLTAFPPMRHLPTTQAESIVLTEGYSPDTLRQLVRRLGAGTPVWSYGAFATPAKARPLASLLTLAEQRPVLHRLHLLGHGLAAADLPLLRQIPVRLHTGPKLSGFQTAYWPAKLSLGETLLVEGTVAAPDAGAWVVLQAAGAGRDSLRLPTGGGPFHLRYQPKAAGLARYELLLRRPGQSTLAEPVPVEITAPVLPAVLLLAAAPSFEFRFLKNHLAEGHYPVALRTSVSRGLVQTDFVNQPAQPLDHLNPALLARFAVLIADASTLAALSGPETQALQAAVRAGRLGLITLAEAAPLPRTVPGRTDFIVQPRATPTVPQPLHWPAMPTEARALLPAHIQPDADLRPLITGPQRAIAAASRRLGLGFTVVSVVPETFRWALQGQQAVYASFWNQLLTAAVPPAPAGATWQTGTRWPRLQQPLTLHFAGNFPETGPTVTALAGGPAVQLALRQDTRLPEWSTAQYWPNASGWHKVRGTGRTIHHFYVYPTGAWSGPLLLENQQAIAAHNAAVSSVSPASTAAVTVSEPWPAGWFFGLFLLAAGYLWLEEKL
ncbi:hypothetical protein [Hymenobacter negativus]|uniref:Aerotolerance regulator N-terminal domain-containing protein n=1 Tax=Hymenobacter negativus TaxID=2795026 RepID=A0ABS3QCF9_9BACT|nr:hypothetical protein [Hymenobacter negativus]MBO2008924.1 hypothetical protein [Hymenobacter negativus]